MLRYWTSKVLEMDFFCTECSAVTSHDILSREPFSVRGNVPPGIPLVCQCRKCGEFFVVFSQELYFGRPSPGADYAKLLSRNRISPGDWLFVDGMSRPERVDAVYKTLSEEVIVAGGKQAGRFTRPTMTSFDDRAPFGFRLLPAQSGVALLGDPVYHVIRKAFGKVVGRVTDGSREKIVVLFEGGKMIVVTLPEECQRASDAVLLEDLSCKLKESFPSSIPNVRLHVVRSIAYVYGSVDRYPDKERLVDFICGLRMFRGCVDMVSVKLSGAPVPDSVIERQLRHLLENEDSPLFNYTLCVADGNLKINACYLSGKDVSPIKSRLGGVAGLRNVSFGLEEIPLPSAQMQQLAIKLSQGFKMNPRLARCSLRVFPLDDCIVVEGRVNNVFQKSLVNFTAIRSLRGAKVLPRLRVENV